MFGWRGVDSGSSWRNVHYADSSERIERRNGGRFLQVEEPHDLQEDFMLVEARSLGFADLCRIRHKSAYAENRIMPRTLRTTSTQVCK